MKIETESQFQKKLMKTLDKIGCYVVKYNASGISKVGVPDVLSCYKGLFVGIECKRDDGEISDIQQWNINQIRNSGGKAWCIRANQLDEFVVEFTNENWDKIGELSLENEKEIEDIS